MNFFFFLKKVFLCVSVENRVSITR